MGFTKKADAEGKKDSIFEGIKYDIKVQDARVLNEKTAACSLFVNGVIIHNVIIYEYTNKNGETKTGINMPSSKNGDKYYDLVFFPLSKEHKDAIIKAVYDALA